MGKITVNVPGVPKGDPVEVLYLGEFPNGETSEYTDEQRDRYKVLSGQDKVPAKVPPDAPKPAAEDGGTTPEGATATIEREGDK